jgi:hypothetical protein
MTLQDDLIDLARRFKAQADHLDAEFVEANDARAIQGGAYCAEADMYRNASHDLFRIARKIENA